MNGRMILGILLLMLATTGCYVRTTVDPYPRRTQKVVVVKPRRRRPIDRHNRCREKYRDCRDYRRDNKYYRDRHNTYYDIRDKYERY